MILRTIITFTVVFGLVCMPVSADMFYGLCWTDGGVYSVDTATQASTLVFNPGITWYGGTDGDTPSTIYGTPLGGSLYRIDVVAHTATQIGSYGYSIKELAYDESTGTLYGSDYTDLYSIDTTTGAATWIGQHSSIDRNWALDYDASIDQLVGIDFTSRSMYYIDRSTGAATLVGSTGTYRITDVWYSNGILWGVGNEPNTLYTLNTSTGAATPVGTLGYNYLGMGSPIPTPGAGLLGVIGLSIVAWARRRN